MGAIGTSASDRNTVFRPAAQPNRGSQATMGAIGTFASNRDTVFRPSTQPNRGSQATMGAIGTFASDQNTVFRSQTDLLLTNGPNAHILPGLRDEVGTRPAAGVLHFCAHT